VAFRLQNIRSAEVGELVSIEARWLLVITTLFAVVVCGSAASIERAAAAAVVEELIVEPIEEVPIDLHGNEVRPAIARYKIDPTGVLYEEHSPDTELPKLAPPRS
jgi:hypothetical protein